MSRDGSGVYTKPFPDVVGSTTISSAVYNGFVNDVAADLNAPRPVLAGGTGAVDATTALFNLGGEKAAQQVTNFDAQVWTPGSFWSNTLATSPPVAGQAFSGVVYIGEALANPPTNANVVVEARSLTDNKVYMRRKTAGVWGAWTPLASTVADLDAAYVNVSGDTMTGGLTVNYASPTIVLNKTAATGQVNYIVGKTSGVTRWAIELGTTTAESGGDAGSDFSLDRFNDAGAYINSPLIIQRATGTLQSTVPSLTFNLRLVESTGGWSKGIRVVNGGNLDIVNNANTTVIASLTDAGAFSAATTVGAGTNVTALGGVYTGFGSAGTGTFYFGNNATSKFVTCNGSDYAWGAGNMSIPGRIFIQPNSDSVDGVINAAIAVGFDGGGTQFGMSFRPVSNTTTAIHFANAAGTNVGSIGLTSTTTAYNTTSDERLKEDLRAFDAGAVLDHIEVFDFKWKAAEERSYGVMAQRAYQHFPSAVHHDEANDTWGVDYSKFVPLLLQEIKALRERVKQLEAVR